MKRKNKIRKKIFLSTTKKRLLIWTVALFTFYIFSYLMDPFDPVWQEYIHEPLKFLITDFPWALLFSIIISEISIFIDYQLNKLLPWSDRSVNRLFLQGFLQIIGSILLVIIVNYIFSDTSDNIPKMDYRKEVTLLGQWVATNIIISLIISAINTGDFLLENWKKSALEVSQHKLRASKHRQAAMSAELQALKLQIDPHFIFNNLSVLSELILENQQLGYEYAENFSKVYRYLLINSKKDSIALDEELKFLDSYIFLIKKRIGEGVIFNISINDEYRNMLIPPMTLQFLVENAIKHNQTLKSNPLEIKIYTIPSKNLVVYNTLSPLVNKAESARVGVKNIMNRFELLGDRKPLILKTEKDFIAKIPLL
ncbi:sensor histidine kinase [Chryseobacterium paridis]|uniref:Histidine kinase n=1 Tax=Chryseobacterium paridis TaxID=2800328 RepID=A0ABS1FW59_9FLAO|nr:histidine kinase [Chryseobacterium paridis]MBK1896639.1 histidine kinase [Chryseobacterium paridis]